MLAYLIALMIAITPFKSDALLTDTELQNITILADRALAIPLSKLASDYSCKHDVTITVSYAPSFEQTIAIQDGDAADLFISAHPKSLQHLKRRGLFDVKSLKPVARANLSLIYSGDIQSIPNKNNLQEAITRPASYIAIASPAATAEGFYAEQALKGFQFGHPPKAEMPDTESMLDITTKEKDEIFYALMFEPDALLNAGDQIISTIPKEWHKPAIFMSAVIPGTDTKLARKFQQHLLSEEAQREFIKYRFYPAEIIN